MCGLHPLCCRNDFLTLFFFFTPPFHSKVQLCKALIFILLITVISGWWKSALCETTTSWQLWTPAAHEGHGCAEHKEIQTPLAPGPSFFFLFHDECYQDATFDYSSFSNWDPFQARAISTPLSVLDRSNFLVLIERFLHWYNLPNGSRGTQRHQMCPGVPRNAPA